MEHRYSQEQCGKYQILPFFSTLVSGLVPEKTSANSCILSIHSRLKLSHFTCFSSSIFLNIYRYIRSASVRLQNSKHVIVCLIYILTDFTYEYYQNTELNAMKHLQQ